MGGWDPVKDIKKAVTEVSNGVKTVGTVVGNAGNLVGGDVGKGINAVAAPIGGFTSAAGDVIGGDLKGAAGRAAGAFLSASPSTMAMNASSSAEELARHDTVNFLTLGMSNDAAEVKRATNHMVSTGEVRDSDLSAMGRQAIRAGVIVGGAALGSTAMNAGKGGLAFAEKAGTIAGGVKAFSKDPVAAAAGYLGVDTDLLNTVRDTVDNVLPAINRAPASQPTKATVATQASSAGPALLFAGGAVGLLVILKLINRGR